MSKRKHPFKRQVWPRDRLHEYGNLFCAECGLASWAKVHKIEPEAAKVPAE